MLCCMVVRMLKSSSLGFPSSHSLSSAALLLLRSPTFGFSTLALLRCQPSKRSMGEIAASKGPLGELKEYEPIVRKRKVIEHIALFQMKEGLTEDQEKDMLDHLYTLQYQLRGIVAVSLGIITGQNTDGCTHALFTRFPSAEALKSYYDSPIRWKIANEYIIPYYNGLICVDYEAEVEDDMVPIFRRGEDFEQGVEFLVLLQVKADTDPRRLQEGFHALSRLVKDLGTLVVQHTSGANFCGLNKGYTHGMVTRFPSEEAKDLFTQHPSYLEIMDRKFQPITHKMLLLDYSVAPIGTTAL